MSSLFDEIFGSEGVKGSPEDRLAEFMANKVMERSVPVVEAKITVGIEKTEANLVGRKEVIDELGAFEDLEAFAEEIRPIMKKYAAKIAKKIEAFIDKNPDKAAHKMAKWLVEEDLKTRR